jgi:hypothetical protein
MREVDIGWGYSIREDGKIFSRRRPGAKGGEKRQVLILGYWNVKLNINKKWRTFKVHRLLAQAFIPNPGNLPIVNHKDGVRSNNSLNNLEWCSISYNQMHAYKIGLRNPHYPYAHLRAELGSYRMKYLRAERLV